MRGTGRVAFAATLLLLAGSLNLIYGIGAVSKANIFTDEHRYILTNVSSMGWTLIVLALIQLTAGFSLMAGNAYGRILAIVGATLGAIGALLSIGGNDPWGSLAVLFLRIHVIHGPVLVGEEPGTAGGDRSRPRLPTP